MVTDQGTVLRAHLRKLMHTFWFKASTNS